MSLEDKQNKFKKKVRFEVNTEQSVNKQLENETESQVPVELNKQFKGCKPKETVGHHWRSTQYAGDDFISETSDTYTQPGKSKPKTPSDRLCRIDRPCRNFSETFTAKHTVHRTDVNRRKVITSPNKKKLQSKKKLVRNVEQSKYENNTRKPLKTPNHLVEVEHEPSRLESPEMYSVLHIAKEIEALKAEDVEVRVASSALLSPVNRQALEEKVTTKLNFAMDDRLYTDLVNLSFDDNLITFETCHKNVPVRKKDKEPCLSDFYIPVGGKEYNCLTQPVLNSTFKIQNKYNGYSVYKRSMLWNDNVNSV